MRGLQAVANRKSTVRSVSAMRTGRLNSSGAVHSYPPIALSRAIAASRSATTTPV